MNTRALAPHPHRMYFTLHSAAPSAPAAYAQARDSRPLVFSLLHPLQELKPVRCFGSDSMQYVTDTLLHVQSVGTCTLAVVFDPASFVHTICTVLHCLPAPARGQLLPEVEFRPIWQDSATRAGPATRVVMAYDVNGDIIVGLVFDQLVLAVFDADSLQFRHTSSIAAIDAVALGVLSSGAAAGVPSEMLLLQAQGLVLYRGLHRIAGVTCALAENTRVVSLRDPVADRVTLVLSNGQLTRIRLHHAPADGLAALCMGYLGHIARRPHADGTAAGRDARCACGLSAEPQLWLSYCAGLAAGLTERAALFGAILSDSSPAPSPDGDLAYMLASETHRRAAHRRVAPNLVLTASSASTRAVSMPTPGVPHAACLLLRLHLLREDCKLDTTRESLLHPLADLLMRLAAAVGWWGYVDYYVREHPALGLDACALRAHNKVWELF
jgi:hypothetical protein